MKIATFNINNINKRLANLLSSLGAAKPDVLCLQELKSTDEAFPIEAIEKAGYSAVFRGQKSWNGVAILVGVGEPVLTHAACLAIQPTRKAATLRRRWTASSSARFMRPMAIRSQVQNLNTSSRG